MVKYVINSISGIWNSYGSPPAEGESVSVYLKDVNNVESDYLPLASLIGLDPSPRQIGTLADSKQISELVVLLPMIEKQGEQLPAANGPPATDDCGECVETFSQVENTKNKQTLDKFIDSPVEGAYLFKIDENIINKILNVDSYRKYDIWKIKDILTSRAEILNLNNNIVKLLFAMVNYYFPPHLNWLLDKSIDPVAMYAAEFKTTLSKQDLSNVWQGTMPDQAMNPEEEEIDIEYFLSEEEIFGGYDIKNIENIEFLVFKCKKIAKSSYEDLKLVNKVEQKQLTWYNYNWPYDNFSLVELLKVDMGEVHDYVYDGSIDYGVLKEPVTKTFVSGTSSYTKQVK